MSKSENWPYFFFRGRLQPESKHMSAKRRRRSGSLEKSDDTQSDKSEISSDDGIKKEQG